MSKYNPKNERIKREYFRYLKEAQQRADTTLNGIRKALARYEDYTGHKDFATFNKDQAVAFKKHLSVQKAQRTNEPISKATMLTTLNALKEFFVWLSWQSGYKTRLHVPDTEYLNLTTKEISVAKAAKHKNYPTLEQIRRVILLMPTETDTQRRDRALIAFTALTGMRDSAIASLRLKHIDLTRTPPLVRQEPDLVKTKFSKQIMTYFFPVGDDLQKIVLDWVTELRDEKLYGMNDPVFPKSKIGHDENRSFALQGLQPQCWSNATPIRQIFKYEFEAAGLPYFNPHLFRHTLTHMGQELCKTPEQMKAWSQNLGHENVLTTFTSYGQIDPYRQGDVIKNLGKSEEGDTKATMQAILEELRKRK